MSDLLTVKRAWVRDFKPALQTNPVTSHPLRRTYTGMIHRCHKVTKGPSYKNYRAKGVQVCERWLNSFEDFVEDMGPKPSPAHSIERLNSNSDYCPENCVWADRTAQANNKSDNKLIEAFGRTQTRAQWANEFGIDYFVLRGRLLRMSPEEALTMEDATRCRIETIDGVSRPLAEWCRRHNMPYKTVLGRVNDHNWDVRKALTTPVAKQTRDLTHNGITMPLAQWARKVGLTEGCLRDRLKRMSLAEAIETPIQRKRISRSR